MEVEWESESIAGDARLFSIRRPGSIVSSFDYVLAVLVFVQVISNLVLYRSLTMGLPLMFTLLLCGWRAFTAMNVIREESMLVIHDLGVQLTRKYASGKETSVFIDREKIKSVVINEGITMHQVIMYMAFRIHGQDSMVLAFESLFPHRHILIPIYQGTREIMFGR